MKYSVLSLAAFAAVAACSDAPRFAVSGAAPGVGVTTSPQGCAASVLFDSARLSSEAPAQLAADFAIPLAFTGEPAAVEVDPRGFFSGAGTARAVLRLGAQEIVLFDAPAPAEQDIDLKLPIDALALFDGGTLALTLASGDDTALFEINSLDFLIVGCNR